MKDEILVAYSTRHESTREIASAIVEVLRAAKLPIMFEPIETVGDLRVFRAAILGCAIYGGDWLPGAAEFLELHARELAGMPVWIFASGPLEPIPQGTKADVPEAVVAAIEKIRPRDIALFAGSLQPHHLGTGLRMLARLARMHFGDHRDWSAIERWAGAIRDDLLGPVQTDIDAARRKALDTF